jgi:hypothetical protein
MPRVLKPEISLKDMLRQQRKSLLNEWSRRILENPAGATAFFLKKEQDRFASPVAFAFEEAIEAIYQAILDDSDADRSAIEYAIKIKALQGQDPSEGVAFIHLIKDIVRKMAAGSIAENEWTDLECRIDRIASTASEMFIANRAKIAALAGKLEGPKLGNAAV